MRASMLSRQSEADSVEAAIVRSRWRDEYSVAKLVYGIASGEIDWSVPVIVICLVVVRAARVQ